MQGWEWRLAEQYPQVNLGEALCCGLGQELQTSSLCWHHQGFSSHFCLNSLFLVLAHLEFEMTQGIELLSSSKVMTDLQQFWVVDHRKKKVLYSEFPFCFHFCFQFGLPQFWFSTLFVLLNHLGSF